MSLSNYLPTIPPPPRSDLQPLPGTIPLTPQAAALPPLLYYLALLLLPPFPEPSTPTTLSKTLHSLIIPLVRNALAFSAAICFFRLPLAYHVPFSIGLTYQLSLVGVYGGCRVVDAFFISLYGFGHVPRRVRYHHAPRDEDDGDDEEDDNAMTTLPAMDDEDVIAEDEDDESVNALSTTKTNDKPTTTTTTTNPHPKLSQKPHHSRSPSQSYFSLHFLQTAGQGRPVTETATTHPHPSSQSTFSTIQDRLSWALEFELAMRGAGFTWTSADVRHTKRSWRPTVLDRLHSIAVHVLPVLLLSWAVVRDVWVHFLLPHQEGGKGGGGGDAFDEALPVQIQLALTAALGAFLMCAFSLGYSLAAIGCHVLFEPHPLAFFPPLYSARVWEVCSVRGFWGYGWHRLFSRLFLVYGVWPGQWVERVVLRGLLSLRSLGRKREVGSGVKGEGGWMEKMMREEVERADVGKVMGGFVCSAAVHAFAGHAVLGGWGHGAGGEAVFFVQNGVAVVVEEGVKRFVRRWRKRGGDGKGGRGLERWYDGLVGRVWWIGVLLWTGRHFARGWTKAGLVAEMAGA